jgi:hypothetical protein
VQDGLQYPAGAAVLVMFRLHLPGSTGRAAACYRACSAKQRVCIHDLPQPQLGLLRVRHCTLPNTAAAGQSGLLGCECKPAIEWQMVTHRTVLHWWLSL